MIVRRRRRTSNVWSNAIVSYFRKKYSRLQYTNCNLPGLSECYLSSMQSRKAWSIYLSQFSICAAVSLNRKEMIRAHNSIFPLFGTCMQHAVCAFCCVYKSKRIIWLLRLMIQQIGKRPIWLHLRKILTLNCSSTSCDLFMSFQCIAIAYLT